MNEKNELSPYVKILKKFKTKQECIDYIKEMKKKDKGDNNGKFYNLCISKRKGLYIWQQLFITKIK